MTRIMIKIEHNGEGQIDDYATFVIGDTGDARAMRLYNELCELLDKRMSELNLNELMLRANWDGEDAGGTIVW